MRRKIKIREKILLIFGMFLVIIFISSCNGSVSIERSCIYYNGWSDGKYQGFEIAKIILKDISLSVFSEKFNKFYLDNHVIDSAFCYGSRSKEGAGYHEKMIFFNKENNSVIWYKCGRGIEDVKSIGLLDFDTWYIITGLMSGTEDIYVYIDKDGNSHSYILGPTNW